MASCVFHSHLKWWECFLAPQFEVVLNGSCVWVHKRARMEGGGNVGCCGGNGGIGGNIVCCGVGGMLYNVAGWKMVLV